ncbi:hypothetical protein LCGC14_2833840, partial [marine sediment metagenome]
MGGKRIVETGLSYTQPILKAQKQEPVQSQARLSGAHYIC